MAKGMNHVCPSFMRVPVLGGALWAFLLEADAADVVSLPRAEFDAFASHVTRQLPPQWHIVESTFGPQHITTHWGKNPIGLGLRLEGPQLGHPLFYSGRPMTPAEHRDYFQDRPESIYIWVVPHSYKPQKDTFVADLFRSDSELTHRLGSTATLDLYAYGGSCHSWSQWQNDLKSNLRR
jgi:hypothetical protein